jgi:hypothetical protein
VQVDPSHAARPRRARKTASSRNMASDSGLVM